MNLPFAPISYPTNSWEWVNALGNDDRDNEMDCDVAAYEDIPQTIPNPVHFPEEIVEMIIKAIDDTPDSIQGTSIPPFQEVKAAWQACALVCRRWYEIVLPYLFHTIIICDRADDYPEFFASHHFLANLVHKAYICNIEELDARILDSLISGLPRLSSLRIEGVEVVDDSGDDSFGTGDQLRRDHALEQLEWYDDNRDLNQDNDADLEFVRDSKTQATSLAIVLSLFSRIGRLNVWTGEAWKNELSVPGGTQDLLRSAMASSRVGHLQLNELTCGDGYIASYFLPDYFCGIQAVNHLTTLRFDFRYCNEMSGFCNLLSATRNTLTSLTMHVYPVWYWSHENDFENFSLVMTFLDRVSSGLVVCSALQELNVEVMVDFGGVHEEVEVEDQPHGPSKVVRELPANVGCWNLATGLVSLVPGNHLRRIRIQLEGSEFSDMHGLDWGSLTQLCRRAPKLETVQIELPQTFDQRGCLAFEMEQYLHVLTPAFIPSDLTLNLACHHQGCRGTGHSHSMDIEIV